MNQESMYPTATAAAIMLEPIQQQFCDIASMNLVNVRLRLPDYKPSLSSRLIGSGPPF